MSWTSQLRSLSPRSKAISLTCVYGLVGGLGAVAFHLAVLAIYQIGMVRLAREDLGTFAVASLFLLIATSAASGYLLSVFCPEAAGSGIPQLKLAYWRDFGALPWRLAWVKFVAGVLSLGGGTSLGREGPSVQFSAALASSTAGILGEAKQARRPAAAAGAAAGLAAAFNTPLAAVTFVLEEILGDLNSRFLGTILLASLIGAFVAQALVGPQPAFQLEPVALTTWRVYAIIPAVAGAASLLGTLFQKGCLALRQRVRTQLPIPAWLRPVFGGVLVWILAIATFSATGRLGVFSLGYDDLSEALRGDLSWQIAALLLVAKFAATVLSYGFGGCGGIFSPTLFLGGMTGVMLAGLIDQASPLSQPEQVMLAVVGMSSCLGAVVRAPVTGILIVFEMTHEFALVPPLMLASLVSQAVSRRFCRLSFYDSLLDQDGHTVVRYQPPRDLRSWQTLPVSTIANFSPVFIDSLDPAALRSTLETHSHAWFPLVQNGVFKGLVSREAARAAAAGGPAPVPLSTPRAAPSDAVRDVQRTLVDSAQQLVVILDPATGRFLGLLTLHDLLRAELAIADRSDA